jgi:5S rRNA maturation endonuclease (ribonuclease M5)
VTIDTAAAPSIDFDALASECEDALGCHQLGLLAADLGVLPEALDRLHVGWSERNRAFTFPMSPAEGPVRGIRLRSHDGRKWSVRGGREGLFVPSDVCLSGLLIICEGPTDAAALIGLRLGAVGRPSCTGGGGLLVDLLALVKPESVAIMADSDAPGQRGARYLASRLVGYVPGGVRIVTPRAKDAREWVRQGADRLDILNAIDAAPVLTLTYGVKAVAR